MTPEPAAEPANAANTTDPTDEQLTDELRAQLARHGVPEDMMERYSFTHGVGGLVQRMEIVFTKLTVDECSATMPVEGNTQLAGILHGGAHVVLAETLGSMAAALWAGEGKQVVGTDINATHHRAIAEGTVTGTARPIHLGRTLTTHEVVMTNDDGKRLSTARITNLIRSK